MPLNIPYMAGMAPMLSLPGATPTPMAPTGGGIFNSALGFGRLPNTYGVAGPTTGLEGPLPGSRTRRIDQLRQQRQGQGQPLTNPYSFMGPMQSPMFGNLPPNQLLQSLSGMQRSNPLPASTFGNMRGYSGYRIPAPNFNFGQQSQQGSGLGF